MNIQKITLITLSSLLVLTAACNSANQKAETKHVNNETIINKTDNAEKTVFTPEGDKTLLFIGQDSDTISDYIKAVPEDDVEGVTLYTQIKSAEPSKTLYAVFKTANWNAGDVSFPKTLAESPNAALAIGLAFDKCNQENHEENITLGHYDKSIDVFVQHLKSLAPRKVFLRIGYEFDGPWNCYTPENYKAAFRKIATAINTKQADNVNTVWQSASWPDSYGNPIYNIGKVDHLESWYPGDDVVDWVSMSVFYRDLSQWNYAPPTTPADGQASVLAFARAHNKPVMIAEAAPQGYRTGALTHSYIQENNQSPRTAEQIWQAWYQPFFDYIDENKDVIRAVAYINTHWESQGMWACKPGIAAGQPGCNGGNWGDSRVQANEYIKNKWLEEVNNSERWIQTSQD